MEQKILQRMISDKTIRADGKKNFVVFYTPEEKKTVEYLEFCKENPGYDSASGYLLEISTRDALDINGVMETYRKKIMEGGM